MSFAKSYSFLFSERLLRLGIGYFLSVLIARSIGPEDYGTFSLIIAIGALLQPVFTFGGEEHSIRYLSSHEEADEVKLGHLFGIRCLGTIIGFALLFIFLLFKEYDTNITHWILIYLSCFLLRPFEIISDYYLYKHQVAGVSKSRIISYLLSSSMRVFAIIYYPHWTSFVLISGIEIIFSLVFYILVFQHEYNFTKWFKYMFHIDKNELKAATKIMFLGVILICSGRIEFLLVESMLSKINLGNYSVIAKILDIIQIVPITFLMVFYPKLCQKQKEGKDQAGRTLYSLLIPIIFLITIFMFFFGELIINLIYSSKYEEGAAKFFYFLIFFMVTILNTSRFRVFAAKNLFNHYISYILFYIIGTIIFNYYFLQQLGLVSIAYSAGLSFILANIVFAIISSNIRDDLADWMKSLHQIKNVNISFYKGLLNKE